MSNWTHEQLTSLGYHRHPDGSYHPHPPSPRLPDPVPQHDPVLPLDPPPQAQSQGQIRTHLRIERISTKLQDVDNFIGGTKPLTDQLRYLGLIPDDDPASITASYHQQKCNKKSAEETIVQITYQSVLPPSATNLPPITPPYPSNK